MPDVSKPLPLGGPPGPGNKSIPILLHKDSGLPCVRSAKKGEIESERDYDISVAYGISYWWFKRKEFYIIRHSASSNRSKVRSYMLILSVVSLKTFERYVYTFLKEIVLRRADYKEYKDLRTDSTIWFWLLLDRMVKDFKLFKFNRGASETRSGQKSIGRMKKEIWR
ncbi:hypothetical protein Tco_0261247 [Tanacetum coccineum]